MPVPHEVYRQILLSKRALILAAVRFDRGERAECWAEDGANYGRLRLISDALRRMSSGDYGRCASCKGEIEQKHLAAVPWACRCRSCGEQSMDSAFEETSFKLAS
jgi:RNA polymerase-binding transcription factor DksA